MVDLLDPLEKIIDVAVALKELIEIFKGKDKWFETCSTYLNSIIETMEKYKKQRNPAKPLPMACQLLQNELEAFQEFLEKEKNRSGFIAFFRGSSMVKEAQEIMSNIEHQIHNFNLALSVDNQIETNDNFRKISSFCSETSKIRTRFQNEKAANMWVQYFFQDESASWVDFGAAMKKYASENDKLELTDSQIEIVLSTIDKDHDCLIQFEEWDSFFINIWSTPSRENILKKTVFLKKSSIQIPPLVLRMKEINTDDPKKFHYPIGHEFSISETKIQFQNYEGQEITLVKQWEKEALIVGRDKPGIFRPDIYFHNKIKSVKEKQFQINLKKFLGSNGFFLNNLSAGSPTTLKIQKMPYIVSNEMIFDLDDTLFEITQIEPNLNSNLEEDSEDYYFVNFFAKQEDEMGEEQTIKKNRRKKKSMANDDDDDDVKVVKKKPVVSPASITIKILQGLETNKQPYQFTHEEKKTEKMIRIGSNKSNEIVVENLADVQMVIKWDPNIEQWVAFCENDGKNSGAFLYLIQASDYNANVLKKGKISVKLRDGMTVGFGYNEMGIIMK